MSGKLALLDHYGRSRQVTLHSGTAELISSALAQNANLTSIEVASVFSFNSGEDSHEAGWRLLCGALVTRPLLAVLRFSVSHASMDLSSLVGCKHVWKLFLCSMAIGTTGLPELIEGLPLLKTVDVSFGCVGICRETLTRIGLALQHSVVASLTISLPFESMSYKSLALSTLPSSTLTQLYITNGGEFNPSNQQALVSTLAEKLHLLVVLDLWLVNISTFTCQAKLTEWICSNKALEKLKISNTKFSEANMHAICNVLLGGNSRISVLNIGYLADWGVQEKLLEIIRCNTVLKSLMVFFLPPPPPLSNRMDWDNAPWLKVLAVNRSLRALNFIELPSSRESVTFSRRLGEINSGIIHLAFDGTYCERFNTRNFMAHERAKAAVYTFLLCSKRMSQLHKDLRHKIARLVSESRAEVGVW